ncbi:hypothetical protein EVG20_g3988 [Dentipellis fragilis]|uniref:FAD-binding domain-containing protein n=1 Tax=Dentipellis fragilis TaxID=205917 RepID=A0A4Y9Z1N9_9AGAM|nr:hypothetical protein EVG20_g3988 [Dentipellis fragilis]
MSTPPPSHAQILVIGGGPSGSYAASALAREGYDVVVFEAATFPRYHIGESLIPSIRHLLRFIDADDKVLAHGFFEKPGAAMKFNRDKREGYTDFIAVGPDNHAWNVVRSEFDELLLNHAGSCGAKVFQATKVTSINFEPSPTSELGRAVSANWTQGEVSGTMTFGHLVDASGRAGIMSMKYLKNRKINTSLKNMAMWGYWTGVGAYKRGDPPVIAPYFQALTDESGWAWFIPLHDGTTSVGIVMDQKVFNQRAKETTSSDSTMGNLLTRYHAALELAPEVIALIGSGTLTKGKGHRGTPTEAELNSNSEEDSVPVIRTASDFSYSSTSYGGEGFRISGDAGAFIDPWFSSGIHLAMTGALSASASIAAVIRGECTEQEATAYHSQRVGVSYTRFLVVVLSAYRQMRAQDFDVLCDVGEDNFDKAFQRIRPLIQGNADLGPRLSETEVQKALDFCNDMFSTAPEQHAAVKKVIQQLDEEAAEVTDAGPAAAGAEAGTAPKMANLAGSWDAFFDVKAPILPISTLEDMAKRVQEKTAKVDPDSGMSAEEETKRVLANINARRIIHRDHEGLHSLEEEELVGYSVRLEPGRLGLERVTVVAASA